MKITKQSEQLMSFFMKNRCFNHTPQSKKTQMILKKILLEIKHGFDTIYEQKMQLGDDAFYNLNISNEIPKPNTFETFHFPEVVIKSINQTSSTLLTYHFTFIQRKIKILFSVPEKNPKIQMYNRFVDNMLVWLQFIDKFASKKCSPELSIFVYHTSLKKMLPTMRNHILNEEHVNTAFTRTCPVTSEIVVFRKEEWFKVFMHETFHNFGLDFSDMNNAHCDAKILSIFKVNSNANFFESYTEFWARIMNALFCSYHSVKYKSHIEEMVSNAEIFINIEIGYSFFQTVKVLQFMDLDYTSLYKNDKNEDKLERYKEKTSVLAYYVVTLILMNHYQDFISWCNENNSSLLQFKKTFKNQDLFCKFIEKKYKSKTMLQGIECGEGLVKRLKPTSTLHLYLLKNLRMTALECELN